eukprot:scaffold12451_cov112-Skeletonema_dohrnii-CCMP3373.AAC.4
MGTSITASDHPNAEYWTINPDHSLMHPTNATTRTRTTDDCTRTEPEQTLKKNECASLAQISSSNMSPHACVQIHASFRPRVYGIIATAVS